MRDFFRSMVMKEDVFIFDITSLPSRSRRLDLLECGSDYRSTGLPQINFGMVVSMEKACRPSTSSFPAASPTLSRLRT